MKSINEFVLEGLKINKNTKFKRSSSIDDIDYSVSDLKWNLKYISKEDLLRICNNALHTTKTFASDILKEIDGYDVDDLMDAWDNNSIPNFKKWNQEVNSIIENNSKYDDCFEEILEEVFKRSYEILEELYKLNS